MKKLIWLIPVILLVAVGIVLGFMFILPKPPPIVTTLSGVSNYYDYHSINTVDASGGAVVWETGADERFAIHHISISGPEALQVRVLDGTNEIGTYYFGINGNPSLTLDIRSIEAGNDLSIITNTAGQISVTVSGTSLWY